MSGNFDSNENVIDLQKVKEEIDKNSYCVPSEKANSVPFTMLPNPLLRNYYNLSLGALGLICHLLSHKDTFHVYDHNLRQLFDIGRDKLQGFKKELRNAGLMKVEEIRGPGGQILGSRTMYSNHPEFLSFNREPEKPVLGDSTESLKSRLPVKPAAGGSDPNNTKDINNIKKTTTTSTTKANNQEETTMRFSNAGAKTDELFVVLNFLVQEGVAKGIAEDLVAKYGLVRGQVVMKGFKSLPVRPNNPGAWLRAAFEKEFKFEEPKKRNEKPLVARSAHTRYVGPNVEETRCINALREEEAKIKSTYSSGQVKELLKGVTKKLKGGNVDVEN